MAASDQNSIGEAARASSPASAVPERSPGAECMLIVTDYVILDGQGQMLRGLNATGAAVWEHIDGRRSLEEIASAIARRYGRPVPKVLEDVVTFTRALADKGLIRFREKAP